MERKSIKKIHIFLKKCSNRPFSSTYHLDMALCIYFRSNIPTVRPAPSGSITAPLSSRWSFASLHSSRLIISRLYARINIPHVSGSFWRQSQLALPMPGHSLPGVYRKRQFSEVSQFRAKVLADSTWWERCFLFFLIPNLTMQLECAWRIIHDCTTKLNSGSGRSLILKWPKQKEKGSAKQTTVAMYRLSGALSWGVESIATWRCPLMVRGTSGGKSGMRMSAILVFNHLYLGKWTSTKTCLF